MCFECRDRCQISDFAGLHFDTYFIQFCAQLSWFSGVLTRTLLNKNEYIYVKDLSFKMLKKKIHLLSLKDYKSGSRLNDHGKMWVPQ